MKQAQSLKPQKLQNDIKYIVALARVPPGAPHKAQKFNKDQEISEGLIDEVMAGVWQPKWIE